MPIPYWRLSSFYFFYFAAVGSFLPFWGLYLKANGFNAVEIGQLSAMLVGTKIIAPNIWGWIADRTGKSLAIIRIASFLAAFLFAGFLAGKSYLWFALISVSFSFFWNASLPQFEALTLQHLKHEPHRYSRIRLWGSIGFIAAVLGIGALLEVLPLSILPGIIASILLSMWIASLLTPQAQAVPHEEVYTGILNILKRPEVWAFLLINMLVQIAHSPYNVFYSIYLKHYHYSSTLIGLLWALGVTSEIVLFIFIRPVLKRFSLRQILLTSLVLTIVRWLIIARFADNLSVLVFAQTLHAATFGGVHISAMHLVQRYFGHHHQGKGQALYNSFSFGVGGMLGSLSSGFFWESMDAAFVFNLSALFSALALLIAFLWVGRENTQKQAGLR